MSKDNKTLFRCGNDLKINVSKCTGETVLDEECCTVVGIILKNTGEIATSFFGAHNPEVIKVLEKTLKVYFKSIKKTLKQEFKHEGPNDIKVVDAEIPNESKWQGEPVPDVEKVDSEENDIDVKSAKKSNSSKKSITSKKTPSAKVSPKASEVKGRKGKESAKTTNDVK